MRLRRKTSTGQQAAPRLDHFPVSLRAFSLIEVVLALGVLSFALVLIIAMLGVGLSNNHDSSSRLQAENIASLLISTRRTDPTNTDLTNFALPALGAANTAGQDVVIPTTNYTKVQTDGTISGGSGADEVIYNLRSIVTPVGPQASIANVDLVLWWPSTLPATASSLPVNNPANYYELTTQIALP
jgi:type II secretory pathway pseudopilin PulG